MRRILGIAAICSVVIASGLYGQESARKIVTIHLGGRSQETLQSFYRAGYDITLFDRNAETANVLVNASEKRQLEELGFATETLLEDADAFAQQLRQQGYLENFHSYDRMLAELQDVAANFPAITQLVDIGDSYEKTAGLGGYDIWALKISDNVTIEENEPEALFMANIHAREIITPEVILYFMHYLVENYGVDPFVTYLVDNRQMWLVPMTNPDGHEYCFSGDGNPFNYNDPIWWRKNKRDNNGDGVFNPNYDGVDLNRNFGYEWGHDDFGSSPNPSSSTYRGTDPFSEPESQAIRNFTEAHNFVVSLSFHSHGRWWLFPWGYDVANPNTPDHAQFVALADSCVAYNGYVPGNGLTIGYPTNGDTDDWFYGEQMTKPKIFAFTPEVGNTAESVGGVSGFFPDTLYIEKQILENQGPLLYMAYAAGENPLIQSAPMPDTEDAAGPYTATATFTQPIILTEPVGLDDATFKLFYSISGAAPFDSVYMTPTGNPNEYSGDIPGLGDNVTIYYYFSATDSAGRTGFLPRTPEKNLLSFDVQSDTIPPIIVHNPISDQSNTCTTFRISALVTDNSGVAEVSVDYRRNGSDLEVAPMSPAGNANEYEVLITPDTVEVGDFFEYRVVARDISQSVNTTIDPAEGFHSFYILNWIVFDFEVDDGDFITNPGGDWQWGAPGTGPTSARSGTNVWGTVLNGNYSDFSDSRLDTPPIDLTGYSNATLTFWHWYQIEYSSGVLWDGGNVKISVDGGPFEIIYPKDGYDGTIDDYNTILPLEPAFGGAAGNGNFWHQEQFDLTPYANSEVVIRFHFGSDANTNEPGWFIDDVQVVLNPTQAPLITNTTQLPNTSDIAGPYTVRAKIADNSAVAAASVRYSVDGGSNYTEVVMTGIGDHIYEGGIPGQPYNTTVFYYVQAEDDSGNIATDPPAAPALYYSFFTTDRMPEIALSPESKSIELLGGGFYVDSILVSNLGLLDLQVSISDTLLSGARSCALLQSTPPELAALRVEKMATALRKDGIVKKLSRKFAIAKSAVSADLQLIINDAPNDIAQLDPFTPPGDEPDLLAVYAENDGANITFEIEFAAPIDRNTYFVLISADLDQDINTGEFPPKSGAHDIGTDLEIVWDTANLIGPQAGFTEPHVLIMDIDINNLFGFAPITFDNNKMSATIPLAMLNNDDGNFNIGVLAMPIFDPTTPWADFAPEVGHAVIGEEPGVSWLSEFPLEGTIAGESSETLYYMVNAGILAPGDYRAAIVFSSNDPQHPEVQFPIDVTVAPMAVETDDAAVPEHFALSQNYPNPFSAGGGSAYGGIPETRIHYEMPRSASVSLKVYNLLGQEIRTLVATQKEAGYHSAVWNGTDAAGNTAPSGVYLLRFESAEYTKTVKMLFIQ